MSKTGKSESIIAEDSFSSLVRKEMLRDIPNVFNYSNQLHTYYCNSFWKTS